MEYKKISARKSIQELVSIYPEIVSIMEEIGFKDITRPMMLQTAGKYMTLEKGAAMKKIPWQTIVETFARHGFEIMKEEE